MRETLLPLDEALALVRAALPRKGSPRLTADRDDPALDRSAMDGAAMRHAEGDAPRILLGTLYAGDDPSRFHIGPHEAVRIMTGAALPAGADAVVPVEELRIEGDRIFPARPPKPGEAIRTRGSQARAGELLLPGGGPSTAARAGLAAQIGMEPEPPRRIQAGIASTGDELAGVPLPHQIRDSNGPMLAALAHRLGADARRLPSLPDDPEALQRRLSDLGNVQVLLTSGGVSMGDKDHLPSVLKALGANILFHKIRLKPGKPMLVALLGDRVVLGLPGNPQSAYLNALLFLPVVLSGLEGSIEPDPWKRGHLGEAVKNPGDRPLLLPCRLQDGRLTPLRSKGSGDLITLAQADACAWIPEGGMEAGETKYLQVV
ncbi:MAG: molybdopterin molybdotransferase MoeA [Holophagaceae bacterium]|nr:molybdopterin molybdotransferase MoeA [Holophagaceae bacterium]